MECSVRFRGCLLECTPASNPARRFFLALGPGTNARLATDGLVAAAAARRAAESASLPLPAGVVAGGGLELVLSERPRVVRRVLAAPKGVEAALAWLSAIRGVCSVLRGEARVPLVPPAPPWVRQAGPWGASSVEVAWGDPGAAVEGREDARVLEQQIIVARLRPLCAPQTLAGALAALPPEAGGWSAGRAPPGGEGGLIENVARFRAAAGARKAKLGPYPPGTRLAVAVAGRNWRGWGPFRRVEGVVGTLRPPHLPPPAPTPSTAERFIDRVRLVRLRLAGGEPPGAAAASTPGSGSSLPQKQV